MFKKSVARLQIYERTVFQLKLDILMNGLNSKTMEVVVSSCNLRLRRFIKNQEENMIMFITD